MDEVPSELNALTELVKQLTDRVNSLEQRLKEDESVICGLSSWTQYALGKLIEHAARPNSLDRVDLSDQIQEAYCRMFDILKLGYRGTAPLQMSGPGFDWMYNHYQATSNIWRSSQRPGGKPDDHGHALTWAALCITPRLHPESQMRQPFESEWEKQMQQASMDVIFEAQERSRSSGGCEPDENTHP